MFKGPALQRACRKTEVSKMKQNINKELVPRGPDFQSVKNSVSAWVNKTKDGAREYLVIVDKAGNKSFLNKVEVKA